MLMYYIFDAVSIKFHFVFTNSNVRSRSPFLVKEVTLMFELLKRAPVSTIVPFFIDL